MREIAACHGKAFRYPVIKSWFLTHYPEVALYGTIEEVGADSHETNVQRPNSASSNLKKTA